MKLKDLPNAISSQDAAGGQSHCENQDGATIDASGQGVALVSRLVAQEAREGKKMNDIYFQYGAASSRSAGLQLSLESRLRGQFPTVGWMKLPPRWRRKNTPLHRRYCALMPLRATMNASGFGLWHSPRSTMIREDVRKFRNRMNGKRPKDRKNGYPNLAVQMGQSLSPSMMDLSAEYRTFNPRFAFWLMRFPDRVTLSILSAMQSTLKSPRGSSKRVCKETLT